MSKWPPICYCKKTEYGDYPHVHVLGLPDLTDVPGADSYRAELHRLRRYERAVVRWAGVNRRGDDHWPVVQALHRLAAASVKRGKRVRRG